MLGAGDAAGARRPALADRSRGSGATRAAAAAILAAGAAAVRPGGVLVYSTCTISQTENQNQIFAFLEANPGFSLDDEVLTLPHRDHTAGFSSRGCAASERVMASERDPTAPGDSGPVSALLGAVAAPDQPAGALPLRVLLAPLGAASVCPNCGEHSTIVRMSSTAILKCNNCGDSMLQPI